MQRTETLKTDARGRRNWTKYAVMGGAALALPLAGHADVVTSGPENITIDGSNSPYNLDLDGDGNTDFIFSSSDEYIFQINSVADNGSTSSYVVDNSGDPAALTSGQVGPSDTFSTGTGTLSEQLITQKGNFPVDGTTYAFLGVEFQNTGGNHYGWVELTTTLGSANTISLDGDGPETSETSGSNCQPTITVKDWAYESDVNTPINIPGTATPEPASLALFATGAAGLALLRRRKQALAK